MQGMVTPNLKTQMIIILAAIVLTNPFVLLYCFTTSALRLFYCFFFEAMPSYGLEIVLQNLAEIT
jgi:hypothetical protein